MKPLVKHSEKSRVLSTKDYSMFEFPDVRISKKHLEFVKESIIEKNLMPDYPVLVDDNYSILDGKYKFLACYELKIPVYYKIAEVTSIYDAVRVKEIHKKTPINEIIQAYNHLEKYSNLLKIKEFFKDLFSYREIISVIDGMLRFPKSFHGSIDRYKLASGGLSDYDVSIVIKRLTTIKYIMDEFKWDQDSAISIMLHKNFKIDMVKDAKILRICYEISTYKNNADQYSIYQYNSCSIEELEQTLNLEMDYNEYEKAYPNNDHIYHAEWRNFSVRNFKLKEKHYQEWLTKNQKPIRNRILNTK